jgi:hypothetical protein
MGAADLRARVARLEKLVMGLTREDDIAKKELPLRNNELVEYRNALGDASRALAVARIVLAGAVRRMEDEAKGGR